MKSLVNIDRHQWLSLLPVVTLTMALSSTYNVISRGAIMTLPSSTIPSSTCLGVHTEVVNLPLPTIALFLSFKGILRSHVIIPFYKSVSNWRFSVRILQTSPLLHDTPFFGF
ncbi:hypothetical protein SAY86_020904 [Trapa natans]|uniref:Uncharacterized protein n=1 Tax=Trapa natans TaxID=22666 RepID=A0AAN7REE3_TRANT|nr:hypothetical protein SAY86_020904 [Trapa natans]